MPPKRPAAAASAAPSTPTKKAKNGQQSLSAFFSSPSKKRVEGAEEVLKTKEEEIGDVEASKEDADADFALQLAAEDAGISVKEMRRRLGLTVNGKTAGANEAAGTASSAAAVHPLFAKTKEQAGPNGSVKVDRPTTPPLSHIVKQEAIAGPSTPKKPPSFDLAALDREIQDIDLAEDVLTFDPTAVSTAQWPRAANNPSQPTTPYALLSHAFIGISSTRSRLYITTVLTNLMRVIKVQDPASLIPAIYLITNHIAPNYEDVQLGIGGAVVNKAIKSVTGKSARTLKQLWDQTGDPGDVAFEAKKDVHPLVKPTPITVQKLFSTLHAIASLTHSGAGSTNAKLSHVTKLLVAARGEENRWLVRTFHSHLRIGAVKKTLSGAMARAFSLIESTESERLPNDVLVGFDERQGVLANPTKAKDRQDPRRLAVMTKFAKAERLVREVLARHPNFTSVLEALVHEPIAEGGLTNLSRLVPLRIGVPLSPMLGSITRSLSDVYVKLGVGTPSARAFVSEFKYDGQRVQVHARRIPEAAVDAESGRLSETARRKRKEIDERGRGKWIGGRGDIYVRLFSRHLEDMTSKYPDILDLVPMLMSREDQPDVEPIESFIIDAEVVAIGAHEGELLPFQTLANRSRKDVNLKDVKVKVGVFAFDLMYLDGKSLLKSSFRLRRRLLHTRFPALAPDNPLVARFAHVRSSESNEPDEVEKFFEEARKNRCEGIMVKTLDHHWQKAPVQSDAKEAGLGANEDGEGDSTQALGEMEKLGEVVSDDLTMEEDDEALREAAKARRDDEEGGQPKRKRKKEEDDETKADVDEPGKGVTGRGKALLSTYEPDKRCESWLKVKRDYVDGIGDSLDLVPIAAWHGMGRKAKWWSPILLAVYDEETGEYQAVCKCISGFTDAEYKSITFDRFPEDNSTPGASCYSARLEQCRHAFDSGGLFPDVWFEPKEVWEVRGADITISPVYPAARGLVDEARGLSMRFPRFMKRRDDKGPEQASSPAQLARVYFNQNAVQPSMVQPSSGAVSAVQYHSQSTKRESGIKREEEGEQEEDEQDYDFDGDGDGEGSGREGEGDGDGDGSRGRIKREYDASSASWDD